MRSVRPGRPAVDRGSWLNRLLVAGGALGSIAAVAALGYAGLLQVPGLPGAPAPPPPPPAVEEALAEAPPPPPPVFGAEIRAPRHVSRASARAPARSTHANLAWPSAISGRCAWAARRSEQLVCHDRELARYDREVYAALEAAARAGAPRWLLAAEQDRWELVQRETAAVISREAMVDAYRTRIAQLQDIAKGP